MDGDGFSESASTVEEVRDLVRAEWPAGLEEAGEVVAVEGDAVLGVGEGLVHAEQGGEHPGPPGLGVCFEVGERLAVQVLDPPRYPGGGQTRQAGALTAPDQQPIRCA